MSSWDRYTNRINAHGGTKRNADFVREVRAINTKLPDSLSYFDVDIYPGKYGFNIESDEAQENKLHQNVAIINSDNLDEKTIISMPTEDIALGSLVYWMNNYWLVSERDANTTLYTRAKLWQCNHLLKWITSSGDIMEQWCVVEDGTKYMTGELEDRDFVVSRGDSRISVAISKNKYTSAFDRENRFLIDDEDAPQKLSYILSKPLKKYQTYEGNGVFQFVLQEVSSTDFDNHELGIADYYKYYPKYDLPDEESKPEYGEENKRKVWL